MPKPPPHRGNPSRHPAAPASRSSLRLAAATLLAAALVAPVTAAVAGSAAARPDATAAVAATADDGRQGFEPRIILYATSWCPWCRKTRALLDELGVAYADKDIEKSPEAAREHREKAGPGAGVPVLDIAGTIVQGYDPAQIRRLVADLESERTETAC